MEAAISFKFVREAGNLVVDPQHPPLVVMFWVLIMLLAGAFYIRLRFAADRTVKYLTEPPKMLRKQSK
jgi:hypothetical protein